MLSCSTTFVSMYKTLSLQGETIYCYPVARPLRVWTKHCLYKVNNIMLSCITTFVSMYTTLSLQDEQYLLSGNTTFVSMYKTLSLQGKQYIVIL